MIVVYTGENPPETYASSIFLAGPSPRKPEDYNWREEAIQLLEEGGFNGVVFAPVYRNNEWSESFNYDKQIKWETKWLNASDLIVFWVPRDLKELPGFTTNVEFGLWVKSGKVLLGSPLDAEKMSYLNWWAEEESVPNFDNLKGLLSAAIEKLEVGEMRTGGEREVPLHLWKKPEFQHWLQTHKSVGNRLDGAKLVWAFRIGKDKSKTIVWALHVDVWIAAEERSKTNEAVVFRPDVSAVVAYCRPPLNTEVDWTLDTEVLFVKEFRSPTASPGAMVFEVPSGSSPKEQAGSEVAISELREETGLEIQDPSRIRYHGVRQIAATLSAHRGHLFSVELTPEEMLSMRWVAGTPFGNEEDSERTYVEVRTVRDVLAFGHADWSNLGLIFQVLVGSQRA
jgi:8-oxo-dGTP pyrophosphatase MutT (NUDIX family)